jgi:hypothetical protein
MPLPAPAGAGRADARGALAAEPHRVRRRGHAAGGGDGPRCGLGREELGLEPGAVDADAEPGYAKGGVSVHSVGFVELYHYHLA